MRTDEVRECVLMTVRVVKLHGLTRKAGNPTYPYKGKHNERGDWEGCGPGDVLAPAVLLLLGR